MKQWDIWLSGYASTGESAPASLAGKYEAETFDDAVELYLKEQEQKWAVRKHYSKTEGYAERNSNGVMPKVMIHRIWAHQLYDNEADAREFFG